MLTGEPVRAEALVRVDQVDAGRAVLARLPARGAVVDVLVAVLARPTLPALAPVVSDDVDARQRVHARVLVLFALVRVCPKKRGRKI
jgi:hypothetical protein